MLVSGVQQSDSVSHIYIYIYIYIYTHTHTHICVCIYIYIYIYILFQILFHYSLLQDIDYSSLCVLHHRWLLGADYWLTCLHTLSAHSVLGTRDTNGTRATPVPEGLIVQEGSKHHRNTLNTQEGTKAPRSSLEESVIAVHASVTIRATGLWGR